MGTEKKVGISTYLHSTYSSTCTKYWHVVSPLTVSLKMSRLSESPTGAGPSVVLVVVEVEGEGGGRSSLSSREGERERHFPPLLPPPPPF